MRFTPEQLAAYKRDGYAVARGVFSREEVAAHRDHLMELRLNGNTYPGDFVGDNVKSEDPDKRFPRFIHIHRFDEMSLQFLLDARLRDCLVELLGVEPYAVQTMVYFKPAGARGTGYHQDQFYLNVYPGTCMGAWMALDDADEENGCMKVVPGSQDLPVLCTVQADTNRVWTNISVDLAPGMVAVPVIMAPGDILFFNGSIIHGSDPNVSRDRFRRSLIGHYIAADAEKVAKWYHPVLRMDGTEVELGVSEKGGKCGVWVERDGTPAVEMVPAVQTTGRALPLHE